MKTLTARNTYETDATQRLDKMAVSFKARKVEDRCPLFCDGKHIHGNRHLTTFTRQGKYLRIYFWNSLCDARVNKLPTAYDVLAAITKCDPGAFEDFCGEFGYDVDSRAAYKTYKAVVKEHEKVSQFFTPDELEKLREVA